MLLVQRTAARVLLVEDNSADVELVREALAKWALPPLLSVVDDGEKAIDYLRRRGVYLGASLPDLVFLDLNLPKMDGIEVLENIRTDAVLSSIPIIILSTSDHEQDVRRAYRLHANCYLTKPLEMDAFIDKIKAVEQFWLIHARLPRNAPV